MFAVSAIVVNYWIRYRYLNDYTQLKEPPLVKPDANELHPDVNTTEPTPAFHNYLDDFLQAVRVFGFLEKPVRASPQQPTRSLTDILNIGIP
jgi:lysophospholipid hydrolase